MIVYTIGHSTHPLDKFIDILLERRIRLLVDIRTIPRSRRNPQYNIDMLPDALGAAGIDYRHAGGLGGLRRARPGSVNQGWRNASFRGFADYMQTDEFNKAIAELVETAAAGQTAIMCAEAVPWRCHRSLVADALQVRGNVVEHITGPGQVRPHTMTALARVSGLKIIYPEKSDEG
jgi:uncharacterized protein (DUF488 family)